MEKNEQTFAGVRVLEFTTVAAGPLIGTYLSFYGAEVIHVEAERRPDTSRYLPPAIKDNPNWGYVFASVNTNKYGITLDITTSQGRELAKKIVAEWADVVIENFTPGVIKRNGLGYEELKKVNKNLIMLSTCNLGQTGPYATHPGMGSHLHHLAGFSHLTGWPDRAPVMLFGPYIDYIAVTMATCALLSALDYRRHTGKGQYIDISQLESGLQFMIPVLLEYGVNGREMTRVANQCHYAAPHGAFPCRGDDRWCIIAVFTDTEWQRLCVVIGQPGLSKHPDFLTLNARKQHESELDNLISQWTATLDAEEVMERLQEAGVEAAVVKGKDLFEDSGYVDSVYKELEHPEAGKYLTRVLPFTLSKTPQQVKKPFPANLGEDNHYFYTKILGLQEKAYQSLKETGII